MADRIITVTNPSVVTNDTLSGYNNYSDIDGQLGTTMTPTEATNGKTVALSDGVVHEVTSKPVGTTNGEFSAVVSNAVTVNLASDTLFEDNFTGTTIDIAKWNVNIPDPAEMNITQNDILFLEGVANGAGASMDTNVIGVNTYSISPLLVCSFDMQSNTFSEDGSFYMVGITKDPVPESNLNRIGLQRSAIPGSVALILRQDGTNELLLNKSLDITTTKTIKIVIDAVNITWYWWDGSWTQLDTIAHASSGNYYPMIGGQVAASGTLNQLYFDNYVLTDEDFVTQRP